MPRSVNRQSGAAQLVEHPCQGEVASSSLVSRSNLLLVLTSILHYCIYAVIRNETVARISPASTRLTAATAEHAPPCFPLKPLSF